MKKLLRLLKYLFFGIILIIILIGSEISLTFNYNITKVTETVFGKVKKVLAVVNEVKTVADFVR